jgi:hypothetical protein
MESHGGIEELGEKPVPLPLFILYFWRYSWIYAILRDKPNIKLYNNK